MTTEQIRILIADDHTMLRTALSDNLRGEPDFEVVGEAGTGSAAVALAETHHPDIVILDIEMPGQDARTTITQLSERCPDTQVVILTMHDTSDLLQPFLELGISGYLHKSATRDTLVNAIRAAGHGEQVTVLLPRRGLATLSSRQPAVCSALSPREAEVLNLVASARSNRQIAVDLGISEGTVKRHLRNIFGKLDAVSRIDAVNKAAGLLDRDSLDDVAGR